MQIETLSNGHVLNRLRMSAEDADRKFPGAWRYVEDDTAAMKAECISRIKQEAAELIAATDWRLQRAKEREEAGWASLAAVDEILMQRESIRRSSDVAEAQVLALTTAAEVESFTWEPVVDVPSPHRVTHAAFLDALEALGEEVIPTILAAVESNSALKKWWTYFDKAQVISASDPRLESGLTGLEIAGVLPTGGAQSVISKLTTTPARDMN